MKLKEKLDSFLHRRYRTFATALAARCVEDGLQRDPTSCVISKLPSSPCILPTVAQSQTHNILSPQPYKRHITAENILRNEHLLCHDIVWVQVPPRSLIDRLHRERQFDLVTPDLKDKQQNNLVRRLTHIHDKVSGVCVSVLPLFQ